MDEGDGYARLRDLFRSGIRACSSKGISACRLRFLALQSVSTDQAILIYLIGLEFANQKIYLSFFDRSEDLLESALAVLLATINMLRFVHLDMASATDVLPWLDTRCRCLQTEVGCA